jgi:hypothetical protein
MEEFTKYEIDYINEYQKRGASANFFFQNKCLLDCETKDGYLPKELYIEAQHRYERMSNP